MLSRALALFWLAALILPTAANAQEPTPEELAEARVHFERARGFEEAEQYERAADEYLSAYALYPDPEFFFNVGRVYRLAEKPRRALSYYERYLELDPDGRAAETAREQSAALREELGDRADRGEPNEEERTEPSEPPGEPEEKPETEPAAAEAPAPLDPSDSGPLAGPSPTDGGDAGGGSFGMRIAGMSTGAVGLAAIGASVYFGNRARTLSNDISAFVDSDPAKWTDPMIDKYEQGQRANQLMFIFGGAGAAAVTTGAVLYVLGLDDGGEEAPNVAIAPTWTPGGAALTLGGSF